MAKLRSVTINSLQDFTRFVDALPKKEIHWYRGCGKASYKLIPTLYRHPGKRAIRNLLDLEKQLLLWFKERSVAFQTRELDDDWDRLFFMQHFRVPTRLLDWTESPLIALYFALTSRSSATKKAAAVWVLKPKPWNAKAAGKMSYGVDIPSAGDVALSSYDPTDLDRDQLRKTPVAMFGTHSSPRMAAQRGTFVIFGKDTKPMEKTYSEDNFPVDALVKLEIPAKSCAPLLRSLRTVGITDSVVFPDLEGLAMEAKRNFGFKV